MTVAAPSTSRMRAVLLVIAAAVAAGGGVGALWAWLAPPVNGIVALTRGGERVRGYLGSEADNWFTSASLFVGMLCVLAVVGAVLLWQWTTHRGPVMAAALAVGSVAAASAAAGVGAAVAHLRYGSVDVAGAPVSQQQRVHYVTEAPSVFFGHSPVQVAVTLLFPAAVAATVYLLAAVGTARDDLGGWPPMEYYPPAPTGRIGTAVDVPPGAPAPPLP